MNSHQRRKRLRLYARVMALPLTSEDCAALADRGEVWLHLSRQKRVWLRVHFDKQPTAEQISFAVQAVHKGS